MLQCAYRRATASGEGLAVDTRALSRSPVLLARHEPCGAWFWVAAPALGGHGFQGLTAQEIGQALGIQHHHHRVARVSNLEGKLDQQ